MPTSVHVAIVLALMTGVAAAQTPAAQPPRPLSPSQQMPAPPRVTFTDGRLQVVANNSTVQDVINAIHGATGTKFQVNGGPTQDRLFGQFGPGPVTAVLRQILLGSGFNYILVSPPQTPGEVQTAMLMAKSNEGTAPVAPPQGQPNQGQLNQGQQANNQENPDAQEEEPPPPEPAQEAPQQQVQPIVQPQQGQYLNGQYPNQQVQQNQQPNQPQDQTQQQNPNQPKTPEQLLQELQRLQQIRNQQQQQNPQNPQ